MRLTIWRRPSTVLSARDRQIEGGVMPREKGHNMICPECKYRVFVMPGQPEAVAMERHFKVAHPPWR